LDWGTHVPLQAPETQAWLAQALAELQVAEMLHFCTPLPEHCTAPGEHDPVQPPEMQLWLQITAVPQAPVSSHVWTPLPEHCVEFGPHTPVHAPIAHA
jgi:hypothetical protein